MIIDAHVHCSPERGAASVAPLRVQCRRNGAALMILSSLGRWSHQPGPDEVRAANDEARDCASASGGLIRWLAYLNPQNSDWRRELDRCRAAGASGVKLWVSLKDNRGRLDRTAAVIRAAAFQRLPLLVHTFHRTDNNLPGEISLEELGGLARRFPRGVLIAAHAGAHWRLGLNILRRLPSNLLVDLSGCYPEQGMLEALVREIGPGRILFGSDALGRSLASQLAKVELAEIPAAARAAILGQNAIRVFSLGAVPSPPAERPRRRLRLPNGDQEHFCFCGFWPFFPTPAPDPQTLNRRLAAAGIRRAWTGDLGSIYRLDLENANRNFLRACRGSSRVAPLATINPRAVNWRQTLAALGRGFAGVILHPYLHNWRLDAPEQAAFFRACAARRRPVWINCALGDYRFRHSGLACRPVGDAELAEFAHTAPANGYVLQGVAAGGIRSMLAARGRGRFRFEISRLTDCSDSLADILREFGIRPFVMGSEFPLRNLRETRWAAERERLVF